MLTRKIVDLIQESGFDINEYERNTIITRSNADQVFIVLLGVIALIGVGFFTFLFSLVSIKIALILSIPVFLFIIFQIIRMSEKNGKYCLEINLEREFFELQSGDIDERIFFFNISEIQCGFETIDLHASDKLPQYLHFIEVLIDDNEPIRLIGIKDISSDPNEAFLEFHSWLKSEIKKAKED